MGKLIEEKLLTELETRLDNLLTENKELKQENILLRRQLEEHVGG